ncbi:MAG: hypothetical protein ABSG53_00380 [Thermoguttaceae bacterium]|jgi:hypothetical protein
MVSFDPYLNWLGIPPHEQPPNLYRLLGIVLFESNPEVIQQAADLQSLRVGGFQAGPQGEMCQQLLSEIAMAQFCLLDPQQKAAYDSQLCEILARRGERAVVAAPPVSMAGSRQFNPSSPMRVPISGAGAMPGPAAMPIPSPQPAMQMPPTMMAAQSGFAPTMPRHSAPAALPVAAPFSAPIAKAIVATPVPARVQHSTAPPTFPPTAPQRPIDELESLTSQVTTRRHTLKKKKTDYTTVTIIGSVVVAAVVLLIIYVAVTGQSSSKHGFDAIEPEKPTESVRAKLAEVRKLNEKIEKEREEQKRAAAARASASGGNTSPIRPDGKTIDRPKNAQAADDGDSSIVAPHKFGPPTRTMDSPDSGGPAQSAPQPNRHDTPQDLGGDNDPVMETPKPQK